MVLGPVEIEMWRLCWSQMWIRRMLRGIAVVIESLGSNDTCFSENGIQVNVIRVRHRQVVVRQLVSQKGARFNGQIRREG